MARSVICAFLTSGFVPPELADGWETCAKAAGDVVQVALAHLYLGRLGFLTDKTDEAREHIVTNVATAHAGDPTWAIADYDEAIKADPQQPAAYNHRGIALPKKGDYDRAVAAYFSRAIAHEGTATRR